MIEQIRKASETWWIKGLFLFMAVAFIIMWGGGDLAHHIGTHNKTVATVGNRKITSNEFADAFNHQVRELQIRIGQLIDENQARQLGLFDIVRERLIQQTLLALEAEHLGIYVSDNYIRNFIRQDKTFQENGKFSHTLFKMLIEKINYNEKTYIEFLRRELTRERLIDALTSGVAIPKAMVVPLFQWQNEQRQINTVTVDSQTIRINEKPSLEVLQEFFTTHKDQFKAPEHRDFLVASFSVENLKNKMIVSQDELEQAYQLHQKDYPEKKLTEVRHQLITDIKNQRLNHELQMLITEIDDAVGAGSTLAEIADKYNLTIKTVVAVDRNGQPDPFNPAAKPLDIKDNISDKMYAQVLGEAFAIDQGNVGSTIETDQEQYFIVSVTGVSATHDRTFDEVAHKLSDYWIRMEQIKRAQNQVKVIVDEINKGGLFNAVAGKYNLKPIAARITRTDVMAPSVLKLNEEALARLYQASKGEPVSFMDTQTDKGIKFTVAVVKSIERAKDNLSTSDVYQAAVSLKQSYINDIINQYLMMLRHKYPVEVNEQFFKKVNNLQN